MTRVLSGIQPSGEAFHLGSWLGAVRQYVALQEDHDCFYMVVDLHALTLAWDPATLARRTRESLAELLAAGVDPLRCTLFIQSHVPEHTQLGWVLECLTGFGQAGRMTAYKDKSARGGDVTVGLFTYPVLQAADILLYQADLVPVGDDQRQHLELTRDLAQRFNSRFGDTFTVPDAVVPAGGAARVMDLQDPVAKMSKSLPAAGTLYLRDSPSVLRKKVRSAVTDAGREVVHDREGKPGVSNLLDLFAELTGTPVDALQETYAGRGYGDLKGDLAEVVVGFAEPYQQRYAELVADTARLDDVLADGARRARGVSSVSLAAAYDAVGLLPPGGSRS